MSGAGPEGAASGRRNGRHALALFAFALLVRLGAMLLLGTPQQAEGASAWEWGAETACLAESVFAEGPYGDPWDHGTGASSWLTPPFPALVGALLRLFGGVGPAAAGALFTVQSLLSAATCLLLVRLGALLGRERVGRLAGWLFALDPLSIWNAVQTVWDTTLLAFGLTAFAVVLLGSSPRPRGALLAGLVFGALAFTNPASLAVLPVVVVYLLLRTEARRAGVLQALVFCAAALAVCLPWMLRNQRELGTLALRPNFGVEVRLGNHDLATGRPQPTLYHPSHVPAELALYRELGEARYGEENLERGLDWIAGHPGRFLALSAKRARLFWLGELPSADRRHSEGRGAGGDWKSWLKYLVYALSGLGALLALVLADLTRVQRLALASALLLFGLPYFVTHVSERYRFPIDPLIVWLDAALLLRWTGRARDEA